MAVVRAVTEWEEAAEVAWVADAGTSARAAVMAAVMLAAEAGVLGVAGRGRGSVSTSGE